MNIRRLLCFFSARSCSTSSSEICGTRGRASRKRLRLGVKPLISLILVICTLFSVFAVNSSASSSVTYSLADFEYAGGDKPLIFGKRTDGGRDVTVVSYNTSTDVRLVSYKKVSDKLKIGSKYTITYSARRGPVGISAFFYLSDNLSNFDNAIEIFSVDTNNLSASYTDYSIQFEYPNQFSGKQAYIVCLIVCNKSSSSLYVTDFVFTDNNSANEEKIDGILEWLSALYHSIVGGEDNRGVQHDGIVQGIKNGLSGLGDRIRDFFSDFWENVSSGFDAIKDKIGDIGEGIKLKFQEISDNFTDIFDTFKPRVYEEFLWQVGSVAYVTGQLTPYPDDRASTSEMFYVADGSVYILDFDPKNSNSSQQVKSFFLYQYDFDGNYIKAIMLSSFSSATSYTLEAGYNYRISVSSSSSFSGQSSYELSKFCNSRVKVYCDEGWINALIHAFMNGLKKLFIPSQGYFESKQTELETFFSEHFGIVYTAGSLSIDVLKKFTSLKPPAQAVLHVPAWQMSLPWENDKIITIVPAMDVNFSEYISSSGVLHKFYKFYRAFITVVIIFMVVNYAKRKFDYVFGKDGEGVE